MNDTKDAVSFPISEFRTSRRVEFADTDMGGIVHFSRFFVFMETAEHELLRTLGVEVHMEVDGHVVGWPRVDARCRYLSPARLGDELEILVRVRKKGRSSMVYEMDFSIAGKTIARGRTASVCCLLDGAEGLKPIALPAAVAAGLTEASPQSG